jgi:hypothetical protein
MITGDSINNESLEREEEMLSLRFQPYNSLPPPGGCLSRPAQLISENFLSNFAMAPESGAVQY